MASARNSTFSFPALGTEINSFRLLRLLPSNDLSSRIRCELFVADINDLNFNYYACSYVWGPEEPVFEIIVDDSAFLIRRNLYELLCACRRMCHPLLLWADSICINQNNINEKAQQVAKMGEIFSGAHCVYAYIGPADSASEFLAGNITKLSAQSPGISNLESSVELSREMVHAINSFNTREYWSRMWIVQEFVLAKHIILFCGSRQIPWEVIEPQIRHTSLQFEDPWSMYSHTVSGIVHAMCSSRFMADPQTFETLFIRFGELSCSVLHDKVFALLSLVSVWSAPKKHFIVDYKHSHWQLLYQLFQKFEFHNPVDFLQLFMKMFDLNSQILNKLPMDKMNIVLRLFAGGLVTQVDSRQPAKFEVPACMAYLCHDDDQEELFNQMGIVSSLDEIQYGTTIYTCGGQKPKAGDLYLHLANAVRIGLVVTDTRPSNLGPPNFDISGLTIPERAGDPLPNNVNHQLSKLFQQLYDGAELTYLPDENSVALEVQFGVFMRFAEVLADAYSEELYGHYLNARPPDAISMEMLFKVGLSCHNPEM
jgi:hypothetical protein